MLEAKGINGGYGDITVLWDVDIRVRPGKVTAILGRNGAGKTSLLDAIAGVLPTVSSDKISLGGDEIGSWSTPRRIAHGLAYVQENKQIFRQRTVEENLLIGGFLLKGGTLRSAERRRALDRAYDRFPILAERRKHSAGALSGGQQQMLAIAQALMPEPRLLMLDEPSAGLAPAIAAEVFDLVATMRDADLSILLVEQVVEEAMAVADDIVVLESGRIAVAGPIEDFSDSALVREVYLGKNIDIETSRESDSDAEHPAHIENEG